MRFEGVNALAFGPFRNRKLKLAPGMNVIHGPNEAGKSSWHAAIYAGLCGMRRAKGPPRREDSEFAARHRPWSQDGDWKVSVVVKLGASDRRVELSHDLVQKVGSAEDVDMAACDYSNQIMYDGAVDGSRWLGLNRQSFRATACVRQADIMGVCESANFLQNALQEAATGAPKDVTAAAALKRLNGYRKKHVGTPLTSKKPLALANARMEKTSTELTMAREKRAEYGRRHANVDELRRTADECRQKVAAVRAVLAKKEADNADRDFQRAQRLKISIADAPGPPPTSDTDLAAHVEIVLENWENRPTLDHRGPSADVIKSEIETADRMLAATRAVIAERIAEKAEHRFARAKELAFHFPHGAPQSAVEDDELAASVRQALAAWKNRPRPTDLEGLSSEAIRDEIDAEDRKLAAARAVAAEHEAKRVEHRLKRIEFASLSGSLLLLVTLAAVMVVAPNWAYVSVLAILFGGWWQLRRIKRIRREASTEREEADELLGAADGRLVARAREDNVGLSDLPRIGTEHTDRRMKLTIELDRRCEAERQWNRDQELIGAARKELVRVATRVGINAQGAARLATELEEWWEACRQSMVEKAELWGKYQGLLSGNSLDEVRTEALHKRKDADDMLDNPVLGLAGGTVTEAREKTSEELSQTVHQSQELRERLQEQLPERVRAENQIADLEAGLAKVARKAGVVDENPERMASALDAWLSNHRERIGGANELQEQKDEFNRLVGERSMSDFADEVESLERRAEELASKLDDAALVIARAPRPDPSRLERLERKRDNAQSELDQERGSLQVFRATLPNIADAEDALAAADREHQRVVRLGATLDRTIQFIESAQDEVFRTVAPVLRRTLLKWLPTVTNGRYDDCRVDPETLQVEVRAVRPGARWRDAALLSHGTAEQIYLLLRLALSRRLAKPGESCPLILDDPVASSDSARKHAVLETLHAISESVQVILFTHEDDVRDWARERLSGSARNRLLELQAAVSLHA